MSPEQACGEAYLSDARTDVFALGAVLCELLTGWPPYHYPGESKPELQLALRRARNAELDEALRRLDGCGEDEELIEEAGKRAVIVKSGNMSLGVNLLAALVKRVAKTLDDDFDIEILEMHHNKKIDAPSGTALMLGRAAAEGRGIDLDQHSQRGRDGHTGARCAGDIGFASLRGGSVVGDHIVIFAGPAERIVLVHRAEDRMIFARGAVRAALWARGQNPGIYSMVDVLGLRDI